MTTETKTTMTEAEASERLDWIAAAWREDDPNADTETGWGVTELDLVVPLGAQRHAVSLTAEWDDDGVTVTVTGESAEAVKTVTLALTDEGDDEVMDWDQAYDEGVIAETPEERMTRMTRQAMADQQAEDDWTD